MEKLHRGDCRELLKTLPENSVDAVVTDPPYALTQVSRGGSLRPPGTGPYGRHMVGTKGFMGLSWDNGELTFDPSFWAEVLRVLKPGGHLLAAGIGRTHHRMMVAVEEAGFEIRDCVYHIFGSGFPKNLDVSKAIDRLKGAERLVVGKYTPPGCKEWNLQQAEDPSVPGSGGMFTASGRRTLAVTAPATEDAIRWRGFGTSLKPAAEIWVLARKPLAEKNVAENVLKWGTGAVNIDACRVTSPCKPASCIGTGWASQDRRNAETGYRPRAYYEEQDGFNYEPHPSGRWPANLVLTHSEECGDVCAPDCPVQTLDKQSGILESGLMKAGTLRRNLCGYQGAMPALTLHDTYGDSGGASRFFYCAKVSPDERWGFCKDCSRAVSPEELDAHRAEKHKVTVHPTQKPLDLMRWLVRLVTPPGGTVLDPFAGSGTTLVAAVLEGFGCIGAEADPEYAEIAEARLLAAREGKAPPVLLKGGLEQLTLF